MKAIARRAAAALLFLASAQAAHALDWSDSELHLQIGRLDIPTFAGGGSTTHFIYTAQHAHGWKYGENFVFVDAQDSRSSAFQDFELYGEWYSNFSLGKLTGSRFGIGPISDIGLILGVNWADDAKVVKYLPGIRISLDLKGFAFANLDVTAYIDDNSGVASGGAPAETDSYMVDLSFARPFRLGSHRFSLEGHIEYIGARRSEFDARVQGWLLAQPQLRWNVGDHLSLGIEYQYWRNKLGDGATDESTVQALVVWRFQE